MDREFRHIILSIALFKVVLRVTGFVIYNNLVAYKNRALNASAQIDIQLKRRYVLILNIVEVAKNTSHTSKKL